MTSTDVQQDFFTIDIECQLQDSFKILDHMRRERKLCDVTLVAENIEIPAHRTVLASGSPYFYAMFANTEPKKQERIILDVDPQILVSVIDYMYSSTLIIPEKKIKGVFDVAKMLLLNRIQNEGRKALQRVMDSNNCLCIKAVAAEYEDSELLNSALSYVDTHFAEVVASEEFLKLTSDEVCELISRDTLNISSEERVFECVARWINHNSKVRRKHLRSLMGCVRLSFISKGYLKRHIVNNAFLRGDSHCKGLIISALLEDDEMISPKTKSRQYRPDAKVLLTVGGFEMEAKKSLEYYDFEKGSWSKSLRMPFGICLTGLAFVNRKVYVVGGDRNGSRVNSVRNYDLASNSWQESVGMTTRRGRHGVAVLNNRIYVAGGSSEDWSTLKFVEKFDPKTQKWTPVAPMLTQRRDLGVTVLNDTLYAIGGCDGNSELKSAESYDQHTDSWRKLRGMKERRRGIAVCALQGNIYAIGGQNGQCLSTVEAYDPDTNSWSEVMPMNVARAWAGVAVLNDKIFVVGGRNDETVLNSVEVYDKNTDSWTMLSESMNVGRSRHAVVIVDYPS